MRPSEGLFPWGVGPVREGGAGDTGADQCVHSGGGADEGRGLAKARSMEEGTLVELVGRGSRAAWVSPVAQGQ
jgi:hypothetical protein